MKNRLIGICLLFSVIGCGQGKQADDNSSGDIRQEVQTYLDEYNNTFRELYYFAAKAEWKSNTYIVKGDEETKKATERANQDLADFTGSKKNIDAARKYLEVKEQLSGLQIKQLETILYMAGANPETAGEVVAEKIKADANQTEKLFGYDFQLDGKSVTTNEIDSILDNDPDLSSRLIAWEASKEVGKELKEGLANLQRLRNKSVQALGYDDYFAYQVSDYGMTSEEMMKECNGIINDVWPLYRELHTWARYTLAEKYKTEVPEMLPAHWLPNRWGQDWTGLVSVEGLDLDGVLAEKDAEWIVVEGEKFYMSLGFEALPKSFYEKSSLYPLPDDAGYKKNNHASAWHMDQDKDVRSLMSIEPNTRWWETTLHELGHIYYYIAYTNDSVPVILRGGANRAYHEAMGSLLGLASMQKPFLEGLGLLPETKMSAEEQQKQETQTLLKEALNYIILIPWGAGVMTGFEHELYANDLPLDQYNRKWWEMKKKYMGIVPPNERGEEFCDACSKTHINNDPAQYYDYALSYVLLFQFHDHISSNILKEDPHATNYYGNKEIGKFLNDLMHPGATVDWRKHLKESLGKEMSAEAMLEYFAPLMEYLKEQNKGREHTLPEHI